MVFKELENIFPARLIILIKNDVSKRNFAQFHEEDFIIRR